jgi:hypothetical protein
MKKQYIQPATMMQPMGFISNICVGSVHGGDFDWGGGTDSESPM